VFVDTATALETALAAAGVAVLDEQTADAIRPEAVCRCFGATWTSDTIPLDAGIESRAISFSGCYVGQEVIIRALHRGHGRVARSFSAWC
jgi:folate-binding protein YgfZ